jgi:hypothetical protein
VERHHHEHSTNQADYRRALVLWNPTQQGLQKNRQITQMITHRKINNRRQPRHHSVVMERNGRDIEPTSDGVDDIRHTV